MPNYDNEAKDRSELETKNTIEAPDEDEARQRIRSKGYYFVTRITERSVQAGSQGKKSNTRKRIFPLDNPELGGQPKLDVLSYVARVLPVLSIFFRRWFPYRFTPQVAPRLSICFRQDDTADVAPRIVKSLSSYFGHQSLVFGLPVPSRDGTRQELRDAVAKCNIIVTLIGQNWLATEKDSTKPLNDPVRIEIEEAFRQEIPVIPVLIGNASMPGEENLPHTLKDLAFCKPVQVDPGSDFQSNMGDLQLAVVGLLGGITVPLADFFHHFSVYIKNGMPIFGALRMLRKRTTSRLLVKVVGDITVSISEGECVSQAMSHHPQVFDKAVVSLVDIGEETGELANALEGAATLIECQQRYRQRPLASFHGQFGLLETSGLPILRVMETLKETVSQELVAPLEDCIKAIRDGCDLAEVYSQYPGIFSSEAVSRTHFQYRLLKTTCELWSDETVDGPTALAFMETLHELLAHAGHSAHVQGKVRHTEFEIWSDETVDATTAIAFMKTLDGLLTDDPLSRVGNMDAGV